MKKQQRTSQERRLRQDWSAFFPGDDELLVCPTCLHVVQGGGDRKKSVAHIVPSASGGGLTTFLCHGCNSAFGADRDVYFGEYLHVVLRKDRDFTSSRQMPKRFRLGGIEVGGEIRNGDDGSLEVIIDGNRSSPKALEELERKLAVWKGNEVGLSSEFAKDCTPPAVEGPPTMDLVFSKPAFSTRGEEIRKAVLTASYLLWFRFLGYSWVLQAHLDSVRDAIVGKRPIDESGAIVSSWTTQNSSGPWFGIAEISGSVVPAGGFADFVCLFPAADATDFATRARSESGRTRLEVSFVFSNDAIAISIGPTGILVRDRMPVCPDQCLKQVEKAKYLLLLHDEPAPQVLRPVSGSAYDEILSQASTKRIKHAGGLVIPRAETTRRA